NALKCCLECHRQIGELHKKRGPEGLVCFDVGAGLNCGTVVAGAIGSERRFSYSVLGDEVNLAARLEGLTRHYPIEIVFSESFNEKLGDDRENLFFDRVKVKGRETPLNLYTPWEMEGAEKEGFARARDLYLMGSFSEARSAFTKLSGQLAVYFENRCSNLEAREGLDWPGYFSWEIK
ncbi:MAG: adenylate cyclase, partial [Verrucomicrobiales bacterium]